MTRGKKQHTVLAVHPGALGDVILFGHLLSALDARVTLLAGGAKAGLLKGLGAVAEAMDINSMPIHEAFTDTPPEQCRLRKLLCRYDRLISCLGGGDHGAELRLAAMCRAGDAAFLPVRPADGFAGHLLDLWTDLLGLPPIAPSPPPWKASQGCLTRAKGRLAGAGVDADRPYVVIHPGAGSPVKCWPVDRFTEVAHRLSRPRHPRADGVAVVFTLGPVEQERWAAGEITQIRRGFPLLACPTLDELAGVLKKAAAFIGNDSGVAHLAAAVGTATVALFGPTKPEHFAPRGRAVKAVWAPKMPDISVEQALSAADALLGQEHTASRRHAKAAMATARGDAPATNVR